MEIAKYLCEFFFTNFWHWLGLVIIIAIFIDGVILNLYRMIINLFKRK